MSSTRVRKGSRALGLLKPRLNPMASKSTIFPPIFSCFLKFFEFSDKFSPFFLDMSAKQRKTFSNTRKYCNHNLFDSLPHFLPSVVPAHVFCTRRFSFLSEIYCLLDVRVNQICLHFFWYLNFFTNQSIAEHLNSTAR